MAHLYFRKNSLKTGLLTGTVAAMTFALFGGRHSFRSWQSQELRRLQTESRLLNTTLGPVEYQVTGTGPAVLYTHGTPGGYDQGLAFAQFIDKHRCMLISPSRPGYLRTPLSSGASPEAQADLYAALLDALSIERASVIGFSGGGPSALQFALRHPDRCSGLVMIGAIVQRNCASERIKALPAWKRFSVELSEQLLVSDPFLYLTLPITRFMRYGKAVAGMLCSGTHYALRKAGYDNDHAQFATLTGYPLERITAPTLIVHGTTDEDVPFADAQLLLRAIPSSTMLMLAGGDHAAFYTYGQIVMPMVGEFLTGLDYATLPPPCVITRGTHSSYEVAAPISL